MRVFPCEVNLAASMIALVSEDKISSGDLPQGIIFRPTKQNSSSERIHPIRYGPRTQPRDQDWSARRARSAQPAGEAAFDSAEGKKRLQSAPGTVVCGDGGEDTYGGSSKQIRGKCHRQILRG